MDYRSALHKLAVPAPLLSRLIHKLLSVLTQPYFNGSKYVNNVLKRAIMNKMMKKA